MEHQVFNEHGLTLALRKSDFLHIPKANQVAYRENLLVESILAAKTKFSAPTNPLTSFMLNGNFVFKLDKHPDRLVERKLTLNLRRTSGIRTTSRSTVIDNLKLFLSEGVSFRVYRLDIRKFYESFSKESINTEIEKVSRLSPKSKLLIKHILEKHDQIGGNGVPRGLQLSSVITEFMMRNFDLQTSGTSHVFFYSRYVDDIIIITSGDEDSKAFIAFIESKLPIGLQLNQKKLYISAKINQLAQVDPATPKFYVACFEYLGYKLSIRNPPKKSADVKHRIVEVDIAVKKANKYKLRISRAFYDFAKTKNWNLLKDRIKYLTNNFKVFNPYIGKTKLAGIYHNYPAIQFDPNNLSGLDYYLRGIVFGRCGRIGNLVTPLLTSSMKRELLSNSFIKGHSSRKFVHFSSQRINEIKQCWER